MAHDVVGFGRSPHASNCMCGIERRRLLGGMLGIAGSALMPSAPASATSPANSIDVHHHFVPPPYLKSLSFAMPPIRDWTPARDIEDLDRAGTRLAMLSVTTPGLWFGDVDKTKSMTRLCNDYAAKMIADHPDRYRLFGALPLPDVEGSLGEIEYGLDVLKADGIGMFTSYEGHYLGDEKFAPVFEELNRRKAIVYVHPSDPQCCVNLLPAVRPAIPAAIVEYGTDTTRTIASLLFSGSAKRYPNVQLIFSHAGGSMPYLIERFQVQSQMPGVDAKLPSDGLMPTLARFYYDTAQTSNPVTMGALRQVVPTTQILFGTDFPYRTSIEHVEGLRRSGFNEEDLSAIYRENALKLMPQLHA
jgi:predicted TIM-barrel fold metal-dependent hydrolase